MARRTAETPFEPPSNRPTADARPGMKLVQFWVPDPTAEGFAEEAKRQADLLRDAPEEREALEFIEAVGWRED